MSVVSQFHENHASLKNGKFMSSEKQPVFRMVTMDFPDSPR